MNSAMNVVKTIGGIPVVVALFGVLIAAYAGYALYVSPEERNMRQSFFYSYGAYLIYILLLILLINYIMS
jgi:heme O synthase-like polyprenyltransferase